MTPDSIVSAAYWIVPLVIAITFHEVAHGLVARHFGDPTAHDAGRLSFNPLRHVDPVGTLVVPLLLAVAGGPIFGWARPVPVRLDRLRDPRWHGLLVTAAGPAMNFALAVVGAALLAVMAAIDGGTASEFSERTLGNFVMVNLFLGVFNLLPLPPLDGSHVVEALLPPALAEHFARLNRFGFVLLMVMLVVLPQISPSLDIVGRLVVPPVTVLSGLLLGSKG